MSVRHRGIFRALLLLYPRWFRDAHGEEMTLLFEVRMERASGARARAGLWWRTLKDAASTAVALHRQDSQGGRPAMETILQDLRYASRRLLRAPGFTLGAVAILAIGLGANTTVFTVVDALLFRPPPWDQPERVIRIYQDSDDGGPGSTSFPAARDIADAGLFAALAATTASSASWEGPDGPEPVATEYTTSAYMDVLGLSVQRGRWFGSEDDVVGGAPVAVVSAAAWRARLGGDPAAVGRTVRLNGQPVTIIGIGPERLDGTFAPLRTDFWLSISATMVSGDFQVANLERRSDHWYEVLARLAPGTTVEQAQASMDGFAIRLAEAYPEFNQGRGISVYSSRDVRMHPQGDGALLAAGGLLSAVVLVLLLLACANLANLLLVRGLSRSGEMAVRAALGASKGRLTRLFLVESLLLAGLGGLAGLALTRLALGAISALPLPVPLSGPIELGVDARVAAFAAALVLCTGIFFGLAPVIGSVRANVSQALRSDRPGHSPGRGALRLRGILVTVQVAASLVLVMGTGLLVRSLSAVQNIDPGVDADRVAYLRVDWSQSGLSGEGARVAMEEVRETMASLPEITHVAWTSQLPAQASGSTTTEVEGYVPAAGTQAVELPFAGVTDDYFEAMGIPLLAGRLFGADDLPDADGTSIVINQTAARRFWGEADPLGRRMRGQGTQTWSRAVIGVVGDVPVRSLSEPPRPMFYFSTRQTGFLPAYLVARTDGDPAAILASMRQAFAPLSPSLEIDGQGTLATHLGESLATPRMAARAMGAFSVLALLLAGVGIYAVVSFTVTKRSAEMGIRIALGARRSGVVHLAVREVAGVVGLGLALGLLVAGVVASRLGGLLYGVSPLDPLALTGSVLALLLVSWTAAFVPAWRAARADPVAALRSS